MQVFHRRGFSRRMADAGALSPLFVAAVYDVAGQMPQMRCLTELAASCVPIPLHLACVVQHQKVLFMEASAVMEHMDSTQDAADLVHAPPRTAKKSNADALRPLALAMPKDGPASSAPPSPPHTVDGLPATVTQELLSSALTQLPPPLLCVWASTSQGLTPPPSPPPSPSSGPSGGVVIAGEDSEEEDVMDELSASQDPGGGGVRPRRPAAAGEKDAEQPICELSSPSAALSQPCVAGGLASQELSGTMHRLANLQHAAERSLLRSVQAHGLRVRDSLQHTAQSVSSSRELLRQSTSRVADAQQHLEELAQQLRLVRHGSSMHKLWLEPTVSRGPHGSHAE